MVAGAVALVALGAITTIRWSGAPAPDLRVAWLLPALRLLADLAAVVTVGCLLAAGILLPGTRQISPSAYAWLRIVPWSAAVWCAAVVLSIPGLLVEYLISDLSAVSPTALASFLGSIPEGRAQAAVVLLTALLAVSSGRVLTVAGVRMLLLLALLAVLPPAFTRHAEVAAEALEVLVETSASAVHVLGVLLWAGGLVALILLRPLTPPLLGEAVRRYSRIALAFPLIVGGSGVLLAWTSLPSPEQVFSTAFGRVALIKGLALLALTALGWLHRRHSLPGLAAGRMTAFLRLAVTDVLIFGATIGLAVGLARAPEPAAGSGAAAQETTRVAALAIHAPPS